MAVRDFVINLVLRAAGFKREATQARADLKETGAEAQKATATAAKGLEHVGQEAAQAGKAMQAAASAGSSGFEALGGVLGKVAGLLGGVAAVRGALSSYVESTLQIERTAGLLDMSMEAWQGWQHAATQAGISAEDLGTRMADLGDWMQDLALHDSGPLADTIKDMGISFKDARGQVVPLEEGLLRLAAATEGMDRQKATSLLTQIGFDEGTIPLIIKGRKGIEDLVRAGKEQALYTRRDAENAQKMRAAWQSVGKVFGVVSASIIRVLGPAFTWIGEKMGGVVKWARENERSLTVFLAALATVIAVAVTPALVGMAAAAWAAILPFAPLIAIVAAAALVIEDLVSWLDGGEIALGDFWALFGSAEEVSAALASTWEGIKTVFAGVVDVSRNMWGLLKAIVTLDFGGIVDSLKAVWAAFSSIADVLGNLLGWLGDKLAGLLPDWVRELMGQDGASGSAPAAPQAPKGVSGAAPYGAAEQARTAAGPVSNTRNVSTSIGQVTVQTQATDAEGIARDMGSALRNQTAQADGAFGV